jgi:hypothetical protein
MNQPKISIEKMPPRKSDGMALASVMAFGIIITLFVTALLDCVLPILQKTAQFKGAGTARSYADLGLDYAIQQMNAGLNDCAANAGSSITWDVPPGVLNDPGSQVSVVVSALPAASTAGTGNPPSTSILYDPLLNAQNQYAYRMVTVTSTYGVAVKQLRCLLEPLLNVNRIPNMPYGIFGVASVVYAGQAGYSTYNTADPRVCGDAGSLGKISQVYGGGGAARSIVEGGSHYEFPDPQAYYTKILNITMPQYNAVPAGSAPWMTMTGNVYSNGVNTAYWPARGTGDSMTASNSATWMNLASQAAHNVLGVTNGIAPSGTIPTGHQSQFVPQASPPSWTGGLTNWNVGPLNSSGVTYPQPTITTTPTAPAGSASLGNVNLNNATLIIDSTAPMPTGPIGTITNSTVRIPPAAYNINSLSLSNNSAIQFTPATQAAIAGGSVQPAAFYVSGTNNGAVVVTVDNTSSINMNNGITSPATGNGFNTSGNIGVTKSNGMTVLQPNQLAITPPGGNGLVVESAGSAGQFQLYYSGSSFNSNSSTYNTQMLLSGNQRMLIYAPNAGILVGSPQVTSNGPSQLSQSCNYYGALVGGSVGINSAYGSGGGVYMHYDANLRPASMKWLNPWSPPPTLMGTNFSGYRAVTWQEAIKPNKNNPALAQWTYQ